MKQNKQTSVSGPSARVLRIANFSPGRRTSVKITRNCESVSVPAVSGPRLVDFQFYHSKARLVHVAGNWNGKKAKRIPLQNLGGGAWVARLLLAPGEYTYHFLADGRWQPDPLATDCLLTDKGTVDSIAIVA